MKDTGHFKAKEFACRCCGVEKMQQAHVDRLEKFRVWYNRSMIINSGYRCEKHNRAVGGARESQHVKGTATDFRLPDEFFSFTKARRAQFLSNIKKKWYELGGTGVGFYDTFVHVDSRPGRKTFWDNRTAK